MVFFLPFFFREDGTLGPQEEPSEAISSSEFFKAINFSKGSSLALGISSRPIWHLYESKSWLVLWIMGQMERVCCSSGLDSIEGLSEALFLDSFLEYLMG